MLNVLEKLLGSPSKGGGWQRIGSDSDTREIPRWVMAALQKESGSQGTRLIDYPDSRRGSIYYHGRTFDYQIKMTHKDWTVYRRRKRRRGNRR